MITSMSKRPERSIATPTESGMSTMISGSMFPIRSTTKGEVEVLHLDRVATGDCPREHVFVAAYGGEGRVVREGYEVLEEITDPGKTGATLNRPGLDQMRNLVAAGGVSVVLAQDRDRFAREPAHGWILREELGKHGCTLRALNDHGDNSPEGILTDGILDQLAAYERAKVAERTRRGLLQKAREGKVIKGPKANYGFKFNDTEDGLLIHEPEMRIVEKIFRMAASGMWPKAVQTRLYA